eukprot:353502-Chlamydomonas_euryale.AAC.5
MTPHRCHAMPCKHGRVGILPMPRAIQACPLWPPSDHTRASHRCAPGTAALPSSRTRPSPAVAAAHLDHRDLCARHHRASQGAHTRFSALASGAPRSVRLVADGAAAERFWRLPENAGRRAKALLGAGGDGGHARKGGGRIAERDGGHRSVPSQRRGDHRDLPRFLFTLLATGPPQAGQGALAPTSVEPVHTALAQASLQTSLQTYGIGASRQPCGLAPVLARKIRRCPRILKQAYMSYI